MRVTGVLVEKGVEKTEKYIFKVIFLFILSTLLALHFTEGGSWDTSF